VPKRKAPTEKKHPRSDPAAPSHARSTDTPIHPNPDVPSFTGIKNPWEFLEKARQIPKHSRGSFTNDYLKLCSKFPPAESDAMVKEGAEVFGYRPQTGYDMVRQFREDGELLPAKAAAIIAEDEGWISEMVFDIGREGQALGYLIHRFDKPHDPPEFVTSVTYQKRVYSPAWSSIINTVLLVPAGIEEYGSDSDLFQAIDRYIQKYVYMDDEKFRQIAAVYVIMTWVFDRFRAIPYLRAIGQFSSGKSRFIEVIGSVCYRALFGSGASSPSSLYRAIASFNGPTLILDEADFAKSAESVEIVKILNQGYQLRGGVWKSERVERKNGEEGNFEVTIYPTYSPKILATRGTFDDPALESRCFNYQTPILREVPPEIPISLDEEFDQDALHLRNKLLLWRFRNRQRIKMDSRARIPGVTESRINQIVQPIVACTKDPALQEVIVDVARRLSDDMRRERQESIEGMVADILLQRWELSGRSDRLSQQAVLDTFTEQFKMKIHPRRFSGIIRGTLNLKVDRVGGLLHIMTPPASMRRLEISYGGSRVPDEIEIVPGPTNGTVVHASPTPTPLSGKHLSQMLTDESLRGIQISSTGAAGPVIE
jgi:hypothetical protein